MIEYRRTKEFTVTELERLFLSVDWFSGRFPQKLQSALKNSPTVISAWDGERLAGLVRGLDDGCWQATVDCLLVDPEYQGQGIASRLIKMLLEDYRDYLYVDVVPDEDGNIAFYEKHGFRRMTEGAALQIANPDWK